MVASGGTAARNHRPKIGRARKGFLLAAFGFGVVGLAVYAVTELARQHEAGVAFVPKRWVDLDAPQRPSSLGVATMSPQRGLLRVAIAPVISPEKSFERYREFVGFLAERLQRTPECQQRGSYAEVNELVRYNRCELAIVCTCAFIQGEREFGMEPLVVPVIDGQTQYHSLVLVPSTSQAESLLDLRGRRFASGDILSTSGWLFPAVWLVQHGEDPESFFGEHIFTGSHDRSVSAAASAYVDGTAVHSQVYSQMLEEDPSIGLKTRVILKSPPYGEPPFVVPRALDPKLKELLRTVMLTMHTDPEGEKVLAPLHIDRFVLPDDDLYDTVRELSKLWEERG